MEKTCNFACCSTGLVGSFICNVEEFAYVLTIAVLNELNDLCLSTKNMRVKNNDWVDLNGRPSFSLIQRSSSSTLSQSGLIMITAFLNICILSYAFRILQEKCRFKAS